MNMRRSDLLKQVDITDHNGIKKKKEERNGGVRETRKEEKTAEMRPVKTEKDRH